MKRSSGTDPAIWMGVGIALGAAFGIALDNLAIGMGVGIALGAAMMGIESKRSEKDDDREGGERHQGPES